MKNILLKLQAQFQRFWQKLSSQQKIIVSALSLVILIALLAISFYIGRPQYVPLFTNLNLEDATNIANKLKESKIIFQIDDSARVIRVPAKDVYNARLFLSSQGVLSAGASSIGFEIFDKTSFGMTEFSQRLNFQRALQGELERTIRQISLIEQARVHLVLPEKQLYEEKEKEPTASVVLKLKPQAKLTKAQISTILNLIKASVEGLKENNISIINTHGQLLSRALEDDEEDYNSEKMSSYFEFKKKVERKIENEVSSMLETILGPNRAVVRVNVELDLIKKESTEETYSPVVDTSGIIRSQQKKTEYAKSSGAIAGMGTGVPGTASNTEGVPNYPQAQTPASSSDYTKDETVTNFEINKKVAHLVSIPGEIKRLSIGVLLDGDFSPEKINTIKQAVFSGIGIVPERGDKIVVENIAFDKSSQEQEKREMENLAKKEKIFLGLKTASIIFVALIVFLFLVSMLRHYQVVNRLKQEIKKTQDVAVVPSAGYQPLPASSAQEADIKQQIDSLIKEKPQKVAEAIKNWLGLT